MGHVTEAQAKTKENSESKLGVVFDKAVLKGGRKWRSTASFRPWRPRCKARFPPPRMMAAVWDREWAVAAALPWAVDAGGGGVAPMGAERSQLNAGFCYQCSKQYCRISDQLDDRRSEWCSQSNTGAVTNGAAANGAINSATRGVVGMQGIALNTASHRQRSGLSYQLCQPQREIR